MLHASDGAPRNATEARAARPGFWQALDIISRAIAPLPAQTVATADSLGRRLAAPLHARRDYPVADVAAMDGFAIAHADIAGAETRWLSLGAPVFAGDAPGVIAMGQTRPISTGALIPVGTGAILIRERAVLADARLALSECLPAGMNIRYAGEDARCGEPVLDSGRVIHPAMIGALCAYGIAQVTVRPRPTVAIITSGDEVRPLDQAGPGDVIDTNGPMIAALLTQAGCRVIRCPAVGDDAGQLERTLADVLAGPVDMLITTGGVSAGDRDLIPGVIAALGAQIHFHGVAMRPGKPVLFATLPDGRPIFALPGNPVAALVGARFFVMRALRIMAGCAVEAPISRGADSEDGVTRILKVRATGNHGVDILPGQQSHMLRPLLDADAWLVRGGGQPSALYPLDDRLDIA